MSRFWIIVATFLIYTAFKVAQLWVVSVPVAFLGAFIIFLLMLGGFLIHRSYSSVFGMSWFHVLSWAGSLTMATWATFILFSIPVDVLSVVAKVAQVREQPHLLQKINATIFCISVVLVMVGFLQLLRGPRVKRVSIKLPDLKSAFRGLKIAHISDLHVGPTLRKGYVEDVVKRVNATQPDLVVFTGDLADAHAHSIAEHLEPLRKLKSRYGKFSVTGNHEYYWGAEELLAKSRELGFTPLVNENTTIQIGDKKMMVAGVTDPAGEMVEGHTPNFDKAAGLSTDSELKVLLAHRPEASDQAEPLGFDLQFSGHTHAGQFFPFSLLIGLFHKYSRGLYRHGRMWVYVNPGTGYWGPADRLAVSPEISLITLA